MPESREGSLVMLVYQRDGSDIPGGWSQAILVFDNRTRIEGGSLLIMVV
jgi:hypothetical protein